MADWEIIDHVELVPPREGKVKAGTSDKWEVIDDVELPPVTTGMNGLTAEDSPLLEGMAQGASFGFSDELMSRLESMVAGTDYKQNWDRKQQELDRLRMLAPGRFLTGEVGGTVATSLLGAGAIGLMGRGAAVAASAAKAAEVAKVVKAASLAKRMGTGFKYGALQGGIEGLGKSKYSFLEDGYENPAMQYALPLAKSLQGAVEGGVGGGAMPIIGLPLAAAAPYGKKLLKTVLPWVSNPLFKVPAETAKEVLEEPGIYKGPIQTMKEVADDTVLPLINKVSREASDAKDAAKAVLTDEMLLTPDQIVKIMAKKFKDNNIIFRDDTGKMTSTFGSGLVSQLRTQAQLAKSLAGKKGYLTEKETHVFYERMKAFAKYGQGADGASKEVADVYKQVRGALNEELQKNGKFKEAMQKSAELTKEVDNVADALKFGRNHGADVSRNGRYAPSDQAEGVMRQIRKKGTTDELVQIFSDKYSPIDLNAAIRRVKNEEIMSLKRPGFASQGGAAASVATGNPIPYLLSLAYDVASPKMFKQIAKATDKSTPGMLDPFTRPAMTNLFTNPIVAPEYVGYPFHGMSAETYREKKANGEVK